MLMILRLLLQLYQHQQQILIDGSDLGEMNIVGKPSLLLTLSSSLLVSPGGV